MQQVDYLRGVDLTWQGSVLSEKKLSNTMLYAGGRGEGREAKIIENGGVTWGKGSWVISGEESWVIIQVISWGGKLGHLGGISWVISGRNFTMRAVHMLLQGEG